MQNLAVQEQLVEDGEQRLEFSATGSEYFRIWIVNLLLTIVTLGIYSAWAKVRSNQYFYSSTRLAGTSFEYHGKPTAILKGRLLAAVLVGAYVYSGAVSDTLLLVMMAIMAALVPLMVWKSLQFKLYNTSYRGIRFGFDGSVSEAYIHFLLLPLLAGTGILAPLMHHRITRFQHGESRFGAAHFRFDGPVSGFFKAYAILVLIVFGLIFGMATLGGMVRVDGDWFVLLFYVLVMSLSPLFFVMIQNVIWNHTTLREHEFRCDMRWGRLIWIYLTNMLGIVCTLGLFIPFAKVRAMKYRLESTTMIVNGSLDNFVAGEKEQVGAMGEGVADFMDLDLSL